MITIDFYNWPHSDELVKYAARHDLEIDKAIEELVRIGLFADSLGRLL